MGVLQSVVATSRVAFRAAACSVAELDDAGAALVFRAADGAGAAEIVGVSIPVSRGIAGWTVVSGQAIAVADVAGDSRFDADTAAQTGYVPSVILAAPLIADGEAVGVIEVLDPRTEADLELLGHFADLAALVLRGGGRGAAGADPAAQALLDAAVAYARGR